MAKLDLIDQYPELFYNKVKNSKYDINFSQEELEQLRILVVGQKNYMEAELLDKKYIEDKYIKNQVNFL